MPISIVLWSELFWPYVGGAEIFAARLMCALRPRGFSFTVITSHDYLDLPDEDSYRGIPVYRLPFRRALEPRHLDDALRLRRRAADLVEAVAADLIHLNGCSPSAFFCLGAARRCEVPLLARLNREPTEPEKGRSVHTLLAQVLESARWTVAVSQQLLDTARSLYPPAVVRSEVIYNGVASGAEQPPPPSIDPPLLLGLGRLAPQKGFDLAIEAMVPVVARWPRARLRLVGDGPERAALAARVAELGLAAHVELAGWAEPEAVAEELAAASLVLMPSRLEGLPSVALQAAAAGRAVIGSRAGGLPEVVCDGETGVLADLDATAFASAISGVLADSGAAARMGAAAWRRVRRDFSDATCFDTYAALYRRLVE